MSRVLIDSNIAIRALKRREARLWENISKSIERGDELYLSSIALMELNVGVLRNSNVETARKKRDKFLELISDVWSFDAGDAEAASFIRTELLARGKMIGAFDLLIAAQAKRRDAIVITNNVDEFSRVSGLRWEDWTA